MSDTFTETKSKNYDLLVFGEVLYDCFPNGKRVLGGAPFNVAWALKGLGEDPYFISAVGDDQSGRQIREKALAWGLDCEGMQTCAELSTGEVRVTIQDDEPAYEICEPRAWDAIRDENLRSGGFIYHGSLALRSSGNTEILKAILQRSSAKRFFDVNLRAPYYDIETLREWVQGTHWLKLNIDEMAMLMGEESIQIHQSQAYLERLCEQFSVENVLLTGGAAGALIHGAYGFAAYMPAPAPVRLIDTVGAGDAFAAYTIHGVLSGLAVEQIVEQASSFASKVCGMQGATSMDAAFYQGH